MGGAALSWSGRACGANGSGRRWATVEDAVAQGRPANQSRVGRSQSMHTPATTIGAKKPGVANPAISTSGASRVSASRALVERRSACTPRMVEAVAAAAAIMQRTRMMVFRPFSPSPVPDRGCSDSTRISSSCTSRVWRVEIR